MLTRDERVEIFKHLHDLLWNGEGFDPTTSRNILLVLFSIRLIEEHSNKLNINEECRYSYLVKTIKDGESELIIVDRFMKIIQELRRNLTTSAFFINAKIVNGDILRKLILKIEEFSNEDLHSSDILGELYEVVGSGDKANSEIGQYFTSREICRFVVNTCIFKKSQFYKKINGERILKNFLDPFGGTGGFAREFVKKGIELGINEWKKEIYVFDRNKNMIPIILLNLLFTTGKIFESSDGSIRSLDSFRDNIKTGKDKVKFPNVEYDFIFTNPPFGGDSQKDKGFTYSSSSGKGKDKTVNFEVNEDIRTIGIVDNDKVSAAVQLCMALLAPKGICAAVLPQGFFFGSGKAKVELRKKLIEEYKVHMVVDIPQDAFLGTTTKTSILIFQKGGETEEIIFNNIQNEFISSATLEDLRKKTYSLDAKMYIEKEEVEIEGFEMRRLGDLVEIKCGKNKTPDDKMGNKYPYYGTSGVTGYTDFYLIDNLHLLIARNGSVGNIFLLDEKTYPSDHMFIVTGEQFILKYVYYYLKNNRSTLSFHARGTTIPGISKNDLSNIEILVPSIKKQEEIVEIISGWDEAIQAKKKEIETFESLIMKTIKLMTIGHERIELSEILLNLPKTKRLAGDGLLEGEYPFLVSSMIKKRYFNEYDYEDQKLIIGGGGNPNIHLEEKFAASGDMLIFEIKNENFLLPYVYYYLLGNMEILDDHYRGTTIKHINIKNFLEIKIPNLPLEKQMILSASFEMVRNGKREVKELQKVFNSFITELIPKV